MSPLLLVLLCTIALLLLLALTLLTVALVKATSSNRKTLLTLLATQMQENQSLRNQLRAPDVPTLNALQYATGSHSEVGEDGYVPVSQEGVIYDAQMNTNDKFKTQDIDDDLVASGWDPLVTRDDGGTPVRFERPE